MAEYEGIHSCFNKKKEPIIHPISGREIPWHEHEWLEVPYHDDSTLKTCKIEGCPISIIEQ